MAADATPETDHGGAGRPGGAALFIGLVLVGAAVSVMLGVYGRVHAPTGQAISTLGYPTLLSMKAWLTTAAAILVVAQVVTALRIYGRIGHGPAPPSVVLAHRFVGVAAVLLTLPVAFQCLWALGFSSVSPRVLVHCVAGCVFYGVFVTKMLALRSSRLPAWAVPVVGGALFAVLVTIWLTSALWYFTA